MSKTYSQVVKQIEALQREADELRRKEIDGVIDRIKDAIKAYGLTAEDLGLARARAPRAAKPGRKGRKPGKRAKGGAAVVKFRDEAGNTWGGRGPRPAWLRNALAAGKQLSDFAV
jgi:DNA-binding protein H-NS